MSIVSSVIVIVLVMVILTSFQLIPATFSIFYHYALGKTTVKKADSLSLAFIFGAELFTAIIWLLIYLILYSIFLNIPDFTNNIFLWILSGILIAESILIFNFYFRRTKSKQSTALFVSRRYAKNLTTRAQSATSRKSAFLLGFFTGVPELLFSLPLYIAANLILLHTNILSRTVVIFIAIVATVIPLFIIYTLYRTGRNLADIQRSRARFKPFLRLFIPTLYLLLALIMINLGLLA